MREPVMHDRHNAGITNQHLVDIACRRIAFIRRLDIAFQQAADFRQLFGK
jgi:hypothetical protein